MELPIDDKDLETIINALALRREILDFIILLRNFKEDRKLRQETEK